MCYCLRSGPLSLQCIIVNLAPKYSTKGQVVLIKSTCYASQVPSTPSFSSFVLTSTTAITDADAWLVKACRDLLNHRLHKNVKGIIQLLGVIKHTSAADRPEENTQTSQRKITNQKWRQWGASWKALRNIALKASVGLCWSWYRVLERDPVITLLLHLNDSPFQRGEQTDPCCFGPIQNEISKFFLGIEVRSFLFNRMPAAVNSSKWETTVPFFVIHSLSNINNRD